MNPHKNIADGQQYDDFEIEIRPLTPGTYLLLATSSAGKRETNFAFPYDDLELENRLKDLQIALLSAASVRRRMAGPEQERVQKFGKELFDLVFSSSDIETIYRISQATAQREGRSGVRIRLRVDAPELAVLPWEYMYDEDENEYTVLSRSTPLVRHVHLPQTIAPYPVQPPLQLLVMIANPQGLPELDKERERQRIDRALTGLQQKGQLQVTWLEGETWRDLQQAMRQGPWHIFHFIGHGGFDKVRDEGVLVLSDDKDQIAPLTATQLGRLLANHASLRLVLLNACEGAYGSTHDILSSTSAILVRRGIPAVIAMQHEISDQAAIEFSQAFYEAIADGYSVDAAVAEARVAVSMGATDSLEWGTPALYMASSSSRLFDLLPISGGGGQLEIAKPSAPLPSLFAARLPDPTPTANRPTAETAATPSPSGLTRSPWLLFGAVAALALIIAVAVWGVWGPDSVGDDPVSPEPGPTFTLVVPAVVTLPESTPTLPSTPTPTEISASLPIVSDSPDMIATKVDDDQIQIDGNDVEWIGPRSVLSAYDDQEQDGYFCNEFNQGSPPGPADLYVEAAVAYNSTYLFLAYWVTDDLFDGYSGDKLFVFLGDAPQLLLDARSAGRQATALGPGVYQIDFLAGVTEIGDKTGAVLWSFSDNSISEPGSTPRQSLSGVQIRATPLSDKHGYFLEAYIPWQSLNIVPQSGRILGVVLGVSDNDVPGTDQQECLVNSVYGNNVWMAPETWGRLTLE